MADSKPNMALERQRVAMQIANIKATVERQKFELMEMDDRRHKNQENIEASEKALNELESKLAVLMANKEQVN